MSPIKLLGQEIAARGGNDLSRLNSDAQPKELQPIAGAIDRLLDRLQTALDAERIIAANSAHELRTPVAGALAQTQQLKEELKSGPGHERVAQIEATLRKLADFTEKLLQLSRASAGVGSTTERQNLSLVLKAIIDEFRGRKLRPVEILVQDDLGQDIQVAMDADAFAIVLRNLIENASLHGTPGRPITVRIADDWCIHVTNDCETVLPQMLQTLKQAYQRGATTSKGSGLGLAISEKIAQKSGGSLELLSPASGRDNGFEAVFCLP